MLDACLGLFGLGQFNELPALDGQQPVFVDQRSRSTSPPHKPTAIALPTRRSWSEIMPPSCILVERGLESGNAVAAGDFHRTRRQLRPIARVVQAPYRPLSDVEQFLPLENASIRVS